MIQTLIEVSFGNFRKRFCFAYSTRISNQFILLKFMCLFSHLAITLYDEGEKILARSNGKDTRYFSYIIV